MPDLVIEQAAANVPVNDQQAAAAAAAAAAVLAPPPPQAGKILLPPFCQGYYIIFLHRVLKKPCTHFIYAYLLGAK